MTVKELIEMLRPMPEDARVYTSDSEYGWVEARDTQVSPDKLRVGIGS